MLILQVEILKYYVVVELLLLTSSLFIICILPIANIVFLPKPKKLRTFQFSLRIRRHELSRPFAF